MSILKNRKILLGVSGSIAAFKSAHIVREFIKRGAEVQVVITDAAKDFVTPLTLSTLSNRPVYSSFIEDDKKAYGVWNNHVEMGLWADLMIIAPASSNTLSKMATGACDNLLSAVYMSAKCPVFVAPAMDLDMFKNGATTSNLEELSKRGIEIIDAEFGELASGLVGKGRMAEPEHIFAAVETYCLESSPLYGKKVLINAGPTHEHLDPVRYLGNNSSGRMGAALAKAAYSLGAEVTLILGPTQASLDIEHIETIHVISAKNMLEATISKFSDAHLTICTAAVSDFRPLTVDINKIKKVDNGSTMTIDLERTSDILASLGALKKEGQYVIGFALETQNGPSYAKDKLVRKSADAIVLNVLGKQGVGFESTTNEVQVYFADGHEIFYPIQSKDILGGVLMSLFTKHFHLRNE
jgi:phosphopantothenoylcysteine decarboxylase/phosphopantothenate--cysteine ligase